MTEKQKEAIEILKRIDIKFFLCGMNEQSNYIVDEADKVNKAIETVLEALENSIPKEVIEEKKEKATKEYQYILDNIERKTSHTKDEHKIRATYAEFGVKRGRLEVLEELEGK